MPEAGNQPNPTSTPGTEAAPQPGNQTAKAPEANAQTTPEFLELEGKKYPTKELTSKLKLAESLDELRRASYDKFRQAAELEKKLQQWSTNFQSDPFEATIQFHENRGLSRNEAEQVARKQFEESYKNRYISPAMMTPEQREAARWKQEAEKAKQERESWEKQKADEAESVHKQALRQAVQKDIIDTIEQHELPKTRFIASRINFYMQQNLKHGFEAPKELIVEQVQKEGKDVIQAFTKGLEGEKLVEWLGPEIIKKIRQYDLGKLQSRLQNKETSEVQVSKQEKKTRSMSDVDKYFNQLRRGRK